MKSLKLAAASAALALALVQGQAMAATGATATLPVQASVTSGCLVAATGLNFGAVSPLLVEEDITAGLPAASGSVILACGTNGPTPGSFITIALDNGANGAIAPILGIGTASTAIRAMTNGTSFLAYDLFQPTSAGHIGALVGQSKCEWGSGGGGETITGVGAGLPCSSGATGLTITDTGYSACLAPEGPFCAATVYGVVPADQVQPLTAGIYTDTVTASVSF
jgi:spore coat protein U-like protein